MQRSDMAPTSLPPTDLHRLSFGHPEHELVAGLEPDQTVAAASQALPRARLGAGGNAALWIVRAYVLLVTLMVFYTFFAGLGSATPS